jgi:hypothetical protein
MVTLQWLSPKGILGLKNSDGAISTGVLPSSSSSLHSFNRLLNTARRTDGN